MDIIMKYLGFLLIVLITPFFSSAKKFSTSYVSFDLLNNWHCFPEATDWVCTNKMNTKSTEATILLTAKQTGPSDSLAQYLNYLKQPRNVKEKNSNKILLSKVFHSKQRIIHQHPWIDGFQSGSEIPDYYTRYLVTKKGSVAILVTYTAHKDHHKKYASDFAKSVSSLRVLKGNFDSGNKGRLGQRTGQNYLQDMIDPTEELDGDELGSDSDNQGLISKLLKNKKATGISLLILALLAYLIIKSRKKKKKKNLANHQEIKASSRKENLKRRRSRSSSRNSNRREKSRSRK